MTDTTKKTPKTISKKKSNKKVKRKKHYPFAFSESTKKKSILGGGCFGKIYLMDHLIDQQKYAVKHIDIKKIQTFLTLFKGKPVSRPKTLDFIFNESKILAKLDHPNVTRYYNTRYTRDIIYISLEVMEGGNLEQAIIKKRFLKQPKLIYNILLQICKGLSYLHSQNIIHRDIKASNILLCDDNWESPKIKLGDFGLSCLMESSCYHQASNQSGAGDLFYRSPEAVAGQPYDTGDDDWAMGIVLLEMISCLILPNYVTGKVFSQYKDFQEYVDSIIEDYCLIENSYYKKLDIIVKGLLNKNPEERLTSNKILDINTHFIPCLSKNRSSTFDIKSKLSPISTDFVFTEEIRPKSA